MASARPEGAPNVLYRDVMPTVYELLDITPPATVRGIPQKPFDGASFKIALDDPAAPTGKCTQFYTMLGTRGIWHDGWFADTVHAASPSGWSHFDQDRWELFHLKALWFAEADKYHGLPLGDLDIVETISRWRPYLFGERNSYTYYSGTADVGAGAAVEIRGRSFAVIAEVTVDTAGAEGVVFKHGGAHGGHVMFLQDGRLHYVYNFLGEEEQHLASADAVPPGKHTFGPAFVRTGTVEGSHTPLGDAALYIDDDEVAAFAGMKIVPATYGLASATLSIGRNAESPVSRAYQAPIVFSGGTIARVNVDVSGKPYADLGRDFARAFAKD